MFLSTVISHNFCLNVPALVSRRLCHSYQRNYSPWVCKTEHLIQSPKMKWWNVWPFHDQVSAAAAAACWVMSRKPRAWKEGGMYEGHCLPNRINFLLIAETTSLDEIFFFFIWSVFTFPLLLKLTGLKRTSIKCVIKNTGGSCRLCSNAC